MYRPRWLDGERIAGHARTIAGHVAAVLTVPTALRTLRSRGVRLAQARPALGSLCA